jgi:hypothetical protein
MQNPKKNSTSVLEHEQHVIEEQNKIREAGKPLRDELRNHFSPAITAVDYLMEFRSFPVIKQMLYDQLAGFMASEIDDLDMPETRGKHMELTKLVVNAIENMFLLFQYDNEEMSKIRSAPPHGSIIEKASEQGQAERRGKDVFNFPEKFNRHGDMIMCFLDEYPREKTTEILYDQMTAYIESGYEEGKVSWTPSYLSFIMQFHKDLGNVLSGVYAIFGALEVSERQQ